MEVVLYTTHCPRCTVLEKKLQQHNISYTSVTDVDEMLRMGLQSAPALNVDGRIMSFKEAVEWINLEVK